MNINAPISPVEKIDLAVADNSSEIIKSSYCNGVKYAKFENILINNKGKASEKVHFITIRVFRPKELYSFLILVNLITEIIL